MARGDRGGRLASTALIALLLACGGDGPTEPIVPLPPVDLMVTRIHERFASEPEGAGQTGRLIYDPLGNLLQYDFFSTPLDAPGARLTRTVLFEYTNGSLVRSQVFAIAETGEPTITGTADYEYDEAGRITRIVTRRLLQPVGQSATTLVRAPGSGFLKEIRVEGAERFWRFEHDRFGNITRVESWADLDNSGRAELTTVSTYAYDTTSRNPLFGIPSAGEILIINGSFPIRFSPHNVVSWEGMAPDGTLGSTGTIGYEFDGSGRPTRRLEEITNVGPPGEPPVSSTAILSEYEYLMGG